MPRYWDARKLLSLMIRYGSSLPDSLKSTSPATVELAGPQRTTAFHRPLPPRSDFLLSLLKTETAAPLRYAPVGG